MFRALVSLLFAEYFLKHMFKEPTIVSGIHISFQMFQVMHGIVEKLMRADRF